MLTLDIQSVSANAYRVLGLAAGASQAEVDGAARRMRLCADEGSSIVNDTPDALPPFHRTRQNIESAVARLTHPETRVVERVLWFCKPAAAATSLGDARGIKGRPTPDEPSWPSDIAQSHDRSLAMVCAITGRGPLSYDWDLWKRAATEIGRLAQSSEYGDWLQRIEADGGFDKPATSGEIIAAQRALAGGMAETCLHLLCDGPGPVPRLCPALRALIEVGEPLATELMLDRVEALLATECDAQRRRIDAAWRTHIIWRLLEACGRADGRFRTSLRPLADLLHDASPGKSGIRSRAHSYGIGLYGHISEACIACRSRRKALRALRTAASMAADPFQARQIAVRSNGPAARSSNERKEARRR